MNTKGNYPVEDTQEVITIERHEIVGTVLPGSGPNRMVPQAFLQAGEYLDHASQFDEEGALVSVQFTYRGVTFTATAEAR